MSHRTKKYDTPEHIGKVMHVEFDLGIIHMPGGDSVDSDEVKSDNYMSEFGEAVRI